MATPDRSPAKRKRKQRGPAPTARSASTPVQYADDPDDGDAEAPRGRAAAPSPRTGTDAQMSAEALRRERRNGVIAALAGAGTVVLTIAAVPVAAAGPRINAPSGSDKALLLGASVAGNAQLLAMWLRVASVLLVIPVAVFMAGAIRGRNPSHSRYIQVLGIVAFLIVGISTAVGFFEVRDAAHIYVASGARTTARANHVLTLQRNKGPLRVADIAQLVGGFLFGIWISLVSYEAMRVGLLTRFLGFFGLGAGVTTVIGLPIGPAIFIGWLGSLSCLAIGFWPGGMPPAWRAGRAISPEETTALMSTPRRSSFLR